MNSLGNKTADNVNVSFAMIYNHWDFLDYGLATFFILSFFVSQSSCMLVIWGISHSKSLTVDLFTCLFVFEMAHSVSVSIPTAISSISGMWVLGDTICSASVILRQFSILASNISRVLLVSERVAIMAHGRGMWVRKDTTKIVITIITACSILVACLLNVSGTSYVGAVYQCLSSSLSVRIHYNIFVIIIPACYIISMSICSIKKTPFCRSNVVGVANPPPESVLTNYRMSIFPTSSQTNLPSLLPEPLRTTMTASELRTTMAMAMLNIPMTILLLIQCTLEVVGNYLSSNILQVIGVITEMFVCLIQPLILIAESSTLRKRIRRNLCRNIENNSANSQPAFQIVSTSSQNMPRDDVRWEPGSIPSFLQQNSSMHISVKVTKNDNYNTQQEHDPSLSLASSFSLDIGSRDGNASVTALSDYTIQSKPPKNSDSLDSVYACAGPSIDQSRRCSFATEPNTPRTQDSLTNASVYFVPAMFVTGSHADASVRDFHLDMRNRNQQNEKIRRSTLPILNSTGHDYPGKVPLHGYMTLVSPTEIRVPKVFHSRNRFFPSDSRHSLQKAEEEMQGNLPGSCQSHL